MQADNEKYEQQIRHLVPINELTEMQQKQVIEQAKILNYEPDSYIFQQGDKDDYTFYLLEGELEMLSQQEAPFQVATDSDRSKYPLSQIQPHQYSAKAINNVTILQINRNTLDDVSATQADSDPSGGLEIGDVESEESADWMTSILQSPLFEKIPAVNIQQLFVRLKPMNVSSGDTVIKQGDEGDYYYIIQKGRCEVTRVNSPGEKPIKLAELGPGDGFGEDELLSNKTRNATITMLTDGTLMQLDKDNFIVLIKNPIVDMVTYEQAEQLIAKGAIWLDVRDADELEESSITNCINIPLLELREKKDTLDINTQYIIYCNSGERSSAATFILSQHRFNVCCLKNGMSLVPDNILEKSKLAKEDTEAGFDEDLAKLETELEVKTPLEKGEIEFQKEQRNSLQDKIQGKIADELKKFRESLVDEVADQNKKNGIKTDERFSEENQDGINELRKMQEETEELIRIERERLGKEQQLEEQKILEERKKIEEESRKIQQTLIDVKKARQEVELERQATEEDVKRLQEEQRQLEKDITETKELNEQQLLQQKEKEEEIRKEIEADLEQWTEEQDENQPDMETGEDNSKHAKNLAERESQKQKKERKDMDALLGDISGQLKEED